MFPDALRLDLLDPEVSRTYGARPERLRDLLEAHPDRKNVVIDEVQKVPELLSVVHDWIERKLDHRFILTGSSARRLRRDGTNWLGGRALVRSMHPFMASELGERFDLTEAMAQGLVPLVMASKDPSDALQAYVALYMREEVQMEAAVRDIGAFSRFLEAISFSHGAVLNIANIARECGVGRKAAEGYVDLLDDMLLSSKLHVFSRRAKRELSVQPKFYLFDAGVFRALRPKGPLDRAEEIEGQALEGLVEQHLRAWTAYRGDGHQLFFWRTRSQVEVDFVVYGPAGLWAIEVKNTGRVRPEDFRSLKTFVADYPSAVPVLLYRGRDRLVQSGIHCVPCEAFLRDLHPTSLPLGALRARV